MKKMILSLSVIVVFALYVFATLSKGEVAAFPGDSKNSAIVSQTPATSLPSDNTTQNSSVVNQPPAVQSGRYKDGQYIGSVADAYYGNVQVQATIQGGKIADVVFLDYPQDRDNSIRINTIAMPMLKSEAIQAQGAQVDGVSGATATSIAFMQSLASALAQA
jgi:uncharacterized protein with FMN-binding domain